MEKKKVLFAFRGDSMCFIHVLLNALDFQERGMGGEIVFEGDAVTLVSTLRDSNHFLHGLYRKAMDRGLIAGACKACSAKLQQTEAVQEEGIALLDDMNGHPSMGGFIEKGYEVITF